jgi:predicted transcriptional regulator
MVKFQLHIRMSEYLGYCVDSISKKLNLSYNAIVMSALNDYVKRHLTEEEQAEILRWIENKNQELVIIEEPEDREWKKHRATMSDAKRKLFEETYIKGLQIAKKDPEFYSKWTQYIDIGELPPRERHPDIEWHRLAFLWKRKLTTKEDIPSLETFKKIREAEKEIEQLKKQQTII